MDLGYVLEHCLRTMTLIFVSRVNETPSFLFFKFILGVFIYRGDFKPNTSVSSKYFPRVKDITLFRVDFDIRENTRLLREKKHNSRWARFKVVYLPL